MNIYEKLSSIQAELKVSKSQFNDFGKYKYRSCEDIVESVKPIAKKHNSLLILSDELENIGDRYYVKATARFIDLEDEKSNIEVTSYAREEETKKGMDASQITGSASSYARKYALNGLFAIDDTKDSDTTNTGNKPSQTQEKPKQTPVKIPEAEQKSKLKELMNLAVVIHGESSAIECIKKYLSLGNYNHTSKIPETKFKDFEQFIKNYEFPDALQDTNLPEDI